MNTLTLTIIRAVLMGIGATLTFDLWGLLLKYALRIPPSNICLVGRWIRYMPAGVFSHANITASPRKRAECLVGWMAHYLIGVTFACIFVAVMGNSWLQRPSLIPAVAFGLFTVLAPFLIMQPSFGFGVAASKSANPGQARIRTLMNHLAFGIGLYLFGLLVHWVLPVSF
jgi:hypothetical protein